MWEGHKPIGLAVAALPAPFYRPLITCRDDTFIPALKSIIETGREIVVIGIRAATGARTRHRLRLTRDFCEISCANNSLCRFTFRMKALTSVSG